MMKVAWRLAMLALLSSVAANASSPIDPYPDAASAYAVVIDGQLTWARALDVPRAPASLAKLLTALVLLDHDFDPEATIVVSNAAARIAGTRAGLRAGESLRAADALTAMLVSSSNDACMALVEHLTSDVPAFAMLMNQRAAKLGMRASHFVQPCGLDAVGQQTTARDLLLLGEAALARAEIATRAGYASVRISTRAGREITLTSSNLLLGRTAGVVGLKSGYTNRAGKCLLVAARRGRHRVWLVLLDAPNRWWVATGLLDAAFSEADASSRAGQ